MRPIPNMSNDPIGNDLTRPREILQRDLGYGWYVFVQPNSIRAVRMMSGLHKHERCALLNINMTTIDHPCEVENQ